MSYQLTRPAGAEPFAACRRLDLADDRVQVEEDARLAGGRVDAVDHARAVDRRRSSPVLTGAARDRVDALAEVAARARLDPDDVAAERRDRGQLGDRRDRRRWDTSTWWLAPGT